MLSSLKEIGSVRECSTVKVDYFEGRGARVCGTIEAKVQNSEYIKRMHSVYYAGQVVKCIIFFFILNRVRQKYFSVHGLAAIGVQNLHQRSSVIYIKNTNGNFLIIVILLVTGMEDIILRTVYTYLRYKISSCYRKLHCNILPLKITKVKDFQWEQQ